MKIHKKSFARNAGCCKFGIFALSIAGLVIQTQAQSYTIVNKNSVLDINVASGPGGVNNWKIDGVDQLNLQWFYYRVGSVGPEYPIENISSAPTVSLGSKSLTVTYANSSYSVRTLYSLTGGNVGSGTSQLDESITINNTSASPLDFHFFQYSDFNIGGVTAGQSVQFYQNPSALPYYNSQSGGYRSVNETVTPASHIEAALYSQTLASLTDGSPTTLNDNPSAGPGDVTFAYQWDFTLAAGGSFQIQKLIGVVPEPSSLALISSGLLGLALLRRQRKK
jgi:hypothetical protein